MSAAHGLSAAYLDGWLGALQDTLQHGGMVTLDALDLEEIMALRMLCKANPSRYRPPTR